MRTALGAGFAYFMIVFAAGFTLGTVRVLILVPHLGELGGTLIELPLMLVISWFVCGWLLRKFSLPGDWQYRFAMGGTAFLWLMVAELSLSMFGFGRSFAEHLETYTAWSARIGLAAQVIFASFPLFRMDTGSPSLRRHPGFDPAQRR